MAEDKANAKQREDEDKANMAYTKARPKAKDA